MTTYQQLNGTQRHVRVCLDAFFLLELAVDEKDDPERIMFCMDWLGECLADLAEHVRLPKARGDA